MVATETAKPFDGTPIATAAEFRKRNRRATGDMVDAAYGSSALRVSVAGGGASVNIGDGRAIVQSALYELSGGPLNKPVTANGGGSNRTDFAVLTYDDSHTPGVYARVLEGTALTQNDAGTWDFPLATWQKTPAGAITSLVDLRAFRGALIVPCTSTLRPADPTLGMIAYEVDTGRHIKWSGTNWTAAIEDTGWATLGLNGKDAGAWSVENPLVYRRINGQVHVRFSLTRRVFQLGLSDENGSTPYVLPIGFRPASSSPPALGFGNHSRNGLMVYVYASGELRVYPLNQDMPENRRIYGQVEFPVD